MQSLEVFEREISDIRRWLFTTLFAYKNASNSITNDIRTGAFLDEVVSNAFNESNCSVSALIRRLSVDNIKACKELALIRSISAFEVFLVDTVQEIFYSNKTPFLKNGKIEFDIGFILTSNDISVLHDRYIEKICRTLHSTGFGEIRKYYKNTFGIDFSSFQCHYANKNYNLSFIEEYHDKRHLIVHRLGKIDEQYQKKYSTNDCTIKLNENDLSLFFDVIIKFSIFLVKELTKHQVVKAVENSAEITLEIINIEAEQYIEPLFPFTKVNGNDIFLSMILTKKEEIGTNLYKLSVCGPQFYIRRYYKFLRKIESSRKIKSVSFTQINNVQVKRKLKLFPWEDIEKVMNLLPERPWKKHIHKDIATQLGWSNNKVSRIINYISNEKNIEIKLDKRRISLHVGDSYVLSPNVNPPEYTWNIEWTSDNDEIAEVNAGIISAITEGITTINARIIGCNSKAICTVAVIK